MTDEPAAPPPASSAPAPLTPGQTIWKLTHIHKWPAAKVARFLEIGLNDYYRLLAAEVRAIEDSYYAKAKRTRDMLPARACKPPRPG